MVYEICREMMSGQLLMPVTDWRTVIRDIAPSVKQATVAKLANAELQ
jgi:hypothetical protein